MTGENVEIPKKTLRETIIRFHPYCQRITKIQSPGDAALEIVFCWDCNTEVGRVYFDEFTARDEEK